MIVSNKKQKQLRKNNEKEKLSEYRLRKLDERKDK